MQFPIKRKRVYLTLFLKQELKQKLKQIGEAIEYLLRNKYLTLFYFPFFLFINCQVKTN